MDKISPENYQVEDFISDESFINYHFKSNKDDQVFWEEWLLNHPGKMDLVMEAKEMLDTLSLSISEKEYRQELKKMLLAINKSNRRAPMPKLPANKLSQFFRGKKNRMQYFLLFLLVLGAVGYWLTHLPAGHSMKLTETVNNSSLPLVLTLSDSTIVSLAPHSHLQYPLQFDASERDVYLFGTARFNVKRNTHQPFKVHAQTLVATVLGTIFNINGSGDSTIEVELLKGKLKVEIMNAALEPAESVLLDPNERAVYVRSDKHLYKSQLIPQNNVAFYQSDFEEVASQIKNVFGVTVINQSNNKSWRFTGRFKNSTAAGIIDNICLVKRLSYVVKEDSIFIK